MSVDTAAMRLVARTIRNQEHCTSLEDDAQALLDSAADEIDDLREARGVDLTETKRKLAEAHAWMDQHNHANCDHAPCLATIAETKRELDVGTKPQPPAAWEVECMSAYNRVVKMLDDIERAHGRPMRKGSSLSIRPELYKSLRVELIERGKWQLNDPRAIICIRGIDILDDFAVAEKEADSAEALNVSSATDVGSKPPPLR